MMKLVNVHPGFRGVLWMLAVCVLLPLPTSRAAILKSTVYQGGVGGYNIYRIPTIVKAANGDLLAFAEARASTNDAGAIDIVVKRSTNGGATWGPLRVVKDNADFAQYLPVGATDITLGNQCPVVDMMDPVHPGRIWMPFALENDRLFTTYSDDHGLTWSPHVEITSTAKLPNVNVVQPGPVHGIQLQLGEKAGRLLVPVAHQTSTGQRHVRDV